MSAFMKKLLGTVVAVGVAGLAHSGVLPASVPPAAVDALAGLILGALHIPQPGAKR